MRKALVFRRKDWEWQYFEEKEINNINCRAVALEIYYMLGGISLRGQNWLDYYIERDMVVYPPNNLCIEDYPIPTETFEIDIKKLGNPYETYYNRYQAIIIKEILSYLTMTFMNESLFQDDKGWIQAGKELKKLFKSNILFLRERVKEYYRCLSFYNELKDIRIKSILELNEFYEQLIKNGVPKEEAFLDAKSHVELQERDRTPMQCKEILSKLILKSEEIVKWQKMFVARARQNDPAIPFYDYIKDLPKEVMATVKGDYLFSQDCYRIAEDITWFLKMIGMKPKSVKELATFWRHNVCPYCHEFYLPKRKNSQTCGKKDCVRGHKNHLKKLRRKMGIYD